MVDYKFILEVARHGARAPSVLYDILAPDQAQFTEAMELTELGADQHYRTGGFVQAKYFAERPLTSMSEANVYA